MTLAPKGSIGFKWDPKPGLLSLFELLSAPSPTHTDFLAPCTTFVLMTFKACHEKHWKFNSNSQICRLHFVIIFQTAVILGWTLHENVSPWRRLATVVLNYWVVNLLPALLARGGFSLCFYPPGGLRQEVMEVSVGQKGKKYCVLAELWHINTSITQTALRYRSWGEMKRGKCWI